MTSDAREVAPGVWCAATPFAITIGWDETMTHDAPMTDDQLQAIKARRDEAVRAKENDPPNGRNYDALYVPIVWGQWAEDHAGADIDALLAEVARFKAIIAAFDTTIDWQTLPGTIDWDAMPIASLDRFKLTITDGDGNALTLRRREEPDA